MSSGKPFHRGEQTAERMPENWRTASAARWQGAYGRRAIPGDQGAHRRFFRKGKPLTWTRHRSGRVRAPSSAGRPARCRFFGRTPHRNSVYRACRRRAKAHIQGDRMRKIRIIEHISLDGVIQAPGGPKEDPGYPYGGWAGPHADPDGGAAIVAAHG